MQIRVLFDGTCWAQNSGVKTNQTMHEYQNIAPEKCNFRFRKNPKNRYKPYLNDCPISLMDSGRALLKSWGRNAAMPEESDVGKKLF